MPRFVQICLLAALCACLAACGSSGSQSSSSNTTAAAGGGGGSGNAGALVGARVAAARCMRAQGIDIPDPGTTRVSVLKMLRVLATFPSVKVNAAEQACMPEIRKAFPNATSLTPAERTKRLQEVEAFATCMRSHGINFPDPASYAGNLAALATALSTVDTSSPAYKAALPGCRATALKDAGG